MGLLPFGVRWFYVQALGTAIRRNDRWSLAHAQPSEELARLLEIARGSERVVEIGAQTGWAAIALAVSEERRSVISFGRPDASHGPERYAHLVEPSVRARIDPREQPADRVAPSIPAPADLVHVDASARYEDIRVALVSAGQIVRPGGLVVVRDHRHREALAAIEELELEGSVVDGLFVGRKPLEPQTTPPSPAELRPSPEELPFLEETARLETARPRLRLLALGVAGSLIGAGAGLAGPLGDSLSGPLQSIQGDGGDAAPTARVPRGANGPEGSSKSARTPARPPARHRPRSDVRAFSGTGRRKLGTIRVNEPMVLRWRAANRSLTIVSEAWRLRSRTQRGATVLSPGAYRRFEVRAQGSWKLTLRRPPAR